MSRRGEQSVRTERNQLAGMVARFQAERKQTFQALNDMNVRLQRSEREKDLMQLDREGFLFNMAEELDDVEALPQDQYERHLEKIKARYQRDPAGGHVADQVRFSREQAGRPSGSSRDEAMERAARAARAGVTYEDALSQETDPRNRAY